MTDEPNHRAHTDQHGPDSETGTGRPETKAEWEALSTEPDNAADLGYRLSNWEEFDVVDDSNQIIFLPSEESELEDDAFLVADSDAVVDLPNRC